MNHEKWTRLLDFNTYLSDNILFCNFESLGSEINMADPEQLMAFFVSLDLRRRSGLYIYITDSSYCKSKKFYFFFDELVSLTLKATFLSLL